MANPTFTIGLGNTAPSLASALLDGASDAVNLAGASVVFTLYELGGETIAFSAAAAITSSSSGRVQYNWQAGDTDVRGHYLGRFTVTYTDLTTQDFPNDRYIDVYVT